MNVISTFWMPYAPQALGLYVRCSFVSGSREPFVESCSVCVRSHVAPPQESPEAPLKSPFSPPPQVPPKFSLSPPVGPLSVPPPP